MVDICLFLKVKERKPKILIDFIVQSILIRCVKCQIFGIWHTKHQKQPLMRCAKCLKIMRHATVYSQIQLTNKNAIILLIILFTFLSPLNTYLSPSTTQLFLSPLWSPSLHCSLFLSHFHFFYLSLSSSHSAFWYYRLCASFSLSLSFFFSCHYLSLFLFLSRRRRRFQSEAELTN